MPLHAEQAYDLRPGDRTRSTRSRRSLRASHPTRKAAKPKLSRSAIPTRLVYAIDLPPQLTSVLSGELRALGLQLRTVSGLDRFMESMRQHRRDAACIVVQIDLRVVVNRSRLQTLIELAKDMPVIVAIENIPAQSREIGLRAGAFAAVGFDDIASSISQAVGQPQPRLSHQDKG